MSLFVRGWCSEIDDALETLIWMTSETVFHLNFIGSFNGVKIALPAAPTENSFHIRNEPMGITDNIQFEH